MSVRFYVDQFRNLGAEMNGEREVMIVTKFMLNENVEKAADYLRLVADKLTELYNAGEVDAAAELLAKAERKIADAQSDEKFCQPVSF